MDKQRPAGVPEQSGLDRFWVNSLGGMRTLIALMVLIAIVSTGYLSLAVQQQNAEIDTLRRETRINAHDAMAANKQYITLLTVATQYLNPHASYRRSVDAKLCIEIRYLVAMARVVLKADLPRSIYTDALIQGCRLP